MCNGHCRTLIFTHGKQAYTCPANECCFGPTNGTTANNGTAGFVTQYATFRPSTFGTINGFSEQVNCSNNIVGTITKENLTATLGTGGQALFQVSDSPNDEGVGIAPYNPAEGVTSGNGMPTRTGSTPALPQNSAMGTYGNILELELGSNIASGTSLGFSCRPATATAT